MINRSSFFFRQVLLFPVLLLTLLAAEALNAAVTFTVTPGSMDASSLAPVTLQITGVAAGSTVLIQKYVDYNGNGAVGANEPMIQSFLVTDNHAVVFGGVTNTAVPGDSNPANGTITVQLNAANNGLTPYFSGKFIYKLSSPSGAFTAITKTFTVNNTTSSAYGSITGHVSFNGTTISNAAIIVLTAPDGGGYTSVGGGFANSSGNFTVKVPPGQYAVGAFLSNYVANIDAATLVTVTAGQSVTNNLTLTKANQAISGKIYDTNSGAGLAGFAIFCQSDNGYAALGFTSPSGTFSVPVNNGNWKISSNDRELGMRGYLSAQESKRVDATGGGVSGVNIAVLKADCMIFGRILDGFGNPVAGVSMYSSDDAGDYEAQGLTDVNGYYYLGAHSGDNWGASIDSPQSPAVDYVYTTDYSRTNIGSGSALEEDFSAIAAPYSISGYVDDSTNGAIAGVDVSASANINGVTYQSAYCETGSSGHYSINVANSNTWTVEVADITGDNGGLNGLGYNSVDPENVVIQNQNGQANFLVPPLGMQELDGYVMDSNGNPVVGVNVDANSSGYPSLVAVTDNNGYYEFYMGNGSWNVNVDCNNLADHGYTNCPPEQDNIPVGGFGGNASGINFVVQAPPPYGPFFDGQVVLGSGWYWLQPANDTNFFGIYNMNSYPYVFHENMGYEYYIDAGDANHGAYFYDFTDGAFFYTSPTLFPELYDFAVDSWVYYSPSTYPTYTSNPRWFFNHTSKQWVTNLTYTTQ